MVNTNVLSAENTCLKKKTPLIYAHIVDGKMMEYNMMIKNIGEEIIKKNPDFYWERDYKTVNFGKEVEEKHFCPVCKKTEFDSLDSHKQCKYCGWIDNMTQEKYPDFKNSSNELSLEEYKENYNRLVSENENYEWSEDN